MYIILYMYIYICMYITCCKLLIKTVYVNRK